MAVFDELFEPPNGHVPTKFQPRSQIIHRDRCIHQNGMTKNLTLWIDANLE